MTEVAEHTELVTSGPADALAGLLGPAGPDLEADQGLPLLWHWLYLVNGRWARTHRVTTAFLDPYPARHRCSPAGGSGSRPSCLPRRQPPLDLGSKLGKEARPFWDAALRMVRSEISRDSRVVIAGALAGRRKPLG
jgi:hypothetical protein